MLVEVYELSQVVDGAVALSPEKSRLPSRVDLFKHVLPQETAYAPALFNRLLTTDN